uniref:FGFR1 oncogene partner 2 homolog n=1 Tax=Steinernema glaseri TaxID=37863 RepID=A0A1I7Z0Q2_9BILA
MYPPCIDSMRLCRERFVPTRRRREYDRTVGDRSVLSWYRDSLKLVLVRAMSAHDQNEIITHMLADLRHLVVGLTSKERTADENLMHGQSVQERIEIMKEYQEKVNDMNGSWRMQSRRSLLNGLQRENRQILALQEENRQLLMTVKEYQDTLNLIMSKHRAVVSSFKNEVHLPSVLERFADKNGTVNGEKLAKFFHALNQCMTHGEMQSQRDQETIKQLRTENVLLRELLNIAEHNSDGVRSQFRSRMCESGTSSSGEPCTAREQSSSSDSSKHSGPEVCRTNGQEVPKCNGTSEEPEEELSLQRCRSRDSCSSEDTVIFDGVSVSGV